MEGSKERGRREARKRKRGKKWKKKRGRETRKGQVCSIHEKKENDLIVALTPTTVYSSEEYYMGVYILSKK